MVVVYVGVLYVIPADVRQLPRDDPRHIRARFVSVACASIACVGAARWLLDGSLTVAGTGWASWEWLGLPAHGWGAASVLPLLLTATLFLAPLLTTGCYIHRCRRESFSFSAGRWQWVMRREQVGWSAAFQHELTSRVGASAEQKLRTLVVGPLSEEVVFRGCMLPLLVVAGGQPPLQACLECPLIFGVAHAHHAYERVARGTHTLKQSLLIALVQNCYTYLFGLFACFLLLRTGHMWAAVLSHTFCNFMGLPDLSYNQVRRSVHATRAPFSLRRFCVLAR